MDPDSFPLPIFEEKTICCTGFAKERREKIQKLVQKFGGVFENRLSTEVDYLIASSKSGSKFDYAR
eukprot:UN05956